MRGAAGRSPVAVGLACLACAAVATPSQAQEPAPAAITGLTSATIEFQVRFVVDATHWSPDSLLHHHVHVGRSVRGSVRARAERRDANPLGEIVGLAPLPPAKLAELRRIMTSEEFDYAKALELCGADAACNRVKDDLLRERLRPGSSADGRGSGFLVLEPDGAEACDSLDVSLADWFEEREFIYKGERGGAPHVSLNASGQTTLADAPELSPLCDVTVVFDLARGVYHVDFPARARTTVAGRALHIGGLLDDPRGMDDAWEISEADPARPLRVDNLQTPRWFTEPSSIPEWTRSEIDTTTDLPAYFTVEWGDSEVREVPVTARVFVTITPHPAPGSRP